MKMPRSRTFAVVLAALTALGFLVRIFLLRGQLPTTDDYLVPLTADFYLSTGQPFPIMPFHPLLRNFLVSLSAAVFGRGTWGVWGFSIVLGSLLITVVALFVRRAARSDTVALIAAGLVAIDILLIDFSRQGIQEVHAAFFAVVGAWLVAEAHATADRRRWRWLLPLAGLAMGLGVASKLYAVAPLLASVMILGVPSLRKRRWDEVVLVFSSLLVVPFTVFLATYWPWFGRGYSFVEWIVFQGATLNAMVTHTKPALGFLANNKPALWFLVPLYADADFVVTAVGPQLSVGLGNPLVWLAVLPAAAYSLFSAVRRRHDWMLHVYFWAAYLPLALSPRPIWVLSAVSVVPFAMPLVASALQDVGRRCGTRVVVVYLALVLLSSALLYPLAIGRALEYEYLAPIVRSLRLDLVQRGSKG